MRSKIIRIAIVSGALCIVGAFMPALSLAGPILFDQTLVNSSAVVNTHVDMLDNCLAAEGCLGFGSTSPVPDVFAAIAFFLNPAQVAAITTTPVIGRFTIVASRPRPHLSSRTVQYRVDSVGSFIASARASPVLKGRSLARP